MPILLQVKNRDRLIQSVLDGVEPEHVNGVGTLLFEMVKGPKKHFHS